MSIKQFSGADVIPHLKAALSYRESLRLNSNALRLVNSRGDGLDGLIIDRFNKHFVVYFLNNFWHRHKREIFDFLCERFSIEYLVLKDRTFLDKPSATQIAVEVLLSRGDSKTTVEENGLLFNVDLNDHLNQGLFLDMRKNRKLLASYAQGKAVLNCFAYTCSFGAYCRKSGASRVTNVDISLKFLKKGKENYQLNRLHIGRSEFVCADTAQYITGAVKRNNFFDIIILDPPSFSRYKGKVFSVKKDMPGMIEKALGALNDFGILFVSTNLSSIFRRQMEEWTYAAARRAIRKIIEIEPLGQDTDFRGSGLMKESFLSALLIKTKKSV